MPDEKLVLENIHENLTFGGSPKGLNVIVQLPLCGLKEGNKFCFPDQKKNPEEVKASKLVAIEGNVGFAVYSLKLVF